jgi:hypothetical protein
LRGERYPALGSHAARSACSKPCRRDLRHWRLHVSVGSSAPVNSAARPGETEAERDDRNLIELLQELRVAGLGVQVLFGFLLSLPFTNRFVELGPPQRGLYVASLLLAAISTALLLGPVAYHRLVFRHHQKERLVRDANIMAIGGLAAVGLAISSAVLLVVSYVDKGLPAVIITAFVACLFVGLWFVLPFVRSRPGPRGESPG